MTLAVLGIDSRVAVVQLTCWNLPTIQDGSRQSEIQMHDYYYSKCSKTHHLKKKIHFMVKGTALIQWGGRTVSHPLPDGFRLLGLGPLWLLFVSDLENSYQLDSE